MEWKRSQPQRSCNLNKDVVYKELEAMEFRLCEEDAKTYRLKGKNRNQLVYIADSLISTIAAEGYGL